MRVEILMPDNVNSKGMHEALRADEQIVVTRDSSDMPDVRLVHSSLLPPNAGALSELVREDGSVIVTAAPRDPEVLASYLISGISGYHLTGESWSQLLDVIREVHAGRYRFDPYVISYVLEHYRLLRKRLHKDNGFGPYLH